MYHRLIEGLGLIRAQDLAHREDMAKRFLLQLAHRLMRLIDGRRDTRSVAMFGFDRGRETRVVRSQFELQRATTHGKALLKQLDLRLLTVVQVELAVQHVVEFDTGRLGLGEEVTPKEHARNGCDEGDDSY